MISALAGTPDFLDMPLPRPGIRYGPNSEIVIIYLCQSQKRLDLEPACPQHLYLLAVGKAEIDPVPV